MKKLLKFLLNLVMALLAVALTLLVVFFISPSWQKGLLEDLLARDSVRKWQIGSVDLKPARVEAAGVFVLDGPVGGEFKFVELRGPFWRAPFTGLLEIESGTLQGVELDLSGIRVGDLTSEDYQTFLERVANDPGLWEERIGLVLSKLSARGLRVRASNLQINGRLLMPGNHVVPVRWLVVEADSAAPRMIEVRRQAPGGQVL